MGPDTAMIVKTFPMGPDISMNANTILWDQTYQ
jgi:hypothetical protein